MQLPFEGEAKGGQEPAADFEQGSENVFLLFSRTKGPGFMVPLKLRKESQSDKKNPRNFMEFQWSFNGFMESGRGQAVFHVEF